MTPDPWLQLGGVVLYLGDAAAVLRTLEDGFAQTVVTSPPYWGLRDYGTGRWEGGAPDCPHTFIPGGTARSTLDQYDNGLNPATIRKQMSERALATYRDVCRKCGARRVDDQLGLEATPQEYVDRLVDVFREVRRVLRDDGTLWINIGDTYSEKQLAGVPWRVAFALQADGWYLRSDCIWAKPNPMPESVSDRPTKSHEYVFLFSKSARYFYDADAVREPLAPDSEARAGRASRYDDPQLARAVPYAAARPRVSKTGDGSAAAGRNLRSVWTLATQSNPDAHFATFPLDLPRRCIRAGTSEKGECSECGAPWRRIVRRESDRPTTLAGRLAEGSRERPVGHPGGVTGGGAMFTGTRSKTLGWEASCSCKAAVVPQIVLDPFLGSGSTLVAARQEGRRGAGVELNPEYLDIAKRRIERYHLKPSRPSDSPPEDQLRIEVAP